MMKSTTRHQVNRVFLITLTLNLFVAAGKIILGLTTGALAITADGFHSLSDGAGSLIGLAGNYFTGQKPDDEHPYGHRRFETLAALFIGALLLLTAWEIGRGAIERLGDRTLPEITPVTFIVLVVTLCVNVFITTYQRREGKRLGSEVLLADSRHTGADVLVTSSVILSMIAISLTGWWWIDVAAALIVVVLILRIGLDILRQTGRVLVDTAPHSPEMLVKMVESIPSVNHVTRARSRGPEDAAHIDIDVQVRPETTAGQTAAITQEIRDHLHSELTGIAEIEVHFIPEQSDPHDYVQSVRAAAYALSIAVHEIHLLDTSEGKVIELHVEVARGQTLADAHELVTELEENLRRALPALHRIVTHIEPASREQISADTEHDDRLKSEIMTLLNRHYPLVNWHQLHLYTGEHGYTLTIHAGISAETSIESAHGLAEYAETLLRSHMPHLNRITIHTEPRK